MSEIKRFDSDGEFVLYKDHQAKIKELESQLEQANKKAIDFHPSNDKLIHHFT